VEATAAALGRDAAAYRRLMLPVVANWHKLTPDLLGPTPIPPRHPILFTRFGLRAIWPATLLARALFRGEAARAVFAGMAAHSMLPLEWPLSSAFGVVLTAGAHAVGWPVARGGSQQFANALGCYLKSKGGEIVTGVTVESMRDLPPAKAYLFDVTPRQLVRIAGDRLPEGYRRRLGKYRYGPGVFKVDWALDGPIPWASALCNRGSVVHLGGTLDEIAHSERGVWRGQHVDRPFILLAQQSLFDPTRAPEDNHTAWAYCHVPHGSTVDMTDRIEGQVERFAPGFRERILARHTFNSETMQRYNANYVGGDINGGVQDAWQHFGRPVFSLTPYATPARDIYICSSSTPPGGGVHGMCGYHAAQAALRRSLRN
jgi:phytoene dehydrogenase-like protein